MNRSVRITLVISLAVNVLLAGVLIGDVSHHFIAGPHGFDVSAQLSKLSPEKRTLFENILEPAQQQMEADRVRMDNAKKIAVSLLKAEPFNETAYRAQLANIVTIHKQMKQKLADAVIDLAKQLDPAERDILADIISHPPFALPPKPENPDKPKNAGE